MKVEINDELADEIVATKLQEVADDQINYLTKLLRTEDSDGHYSWNIDEEIFSVINEIESLNSIIDHFGGFTKDLSLILEKENKTIYETVVNFEEMKSQKEQWQKEALALRDEIAELKGKISKILDV